MSSERDLRDQTVPVKQTHLNGTSFRSFHYFEEKSKNRNNASVIEQSIQGYIPIQYQARHLIQLK